MENIKITTKSLQVFVEKYSSEPLKKEDNNKILLFDNHRAKLESLKFFIV